MSDKIVAVFFKQDGSANEDGVKVLCRVPAGARVLGANLLTLEPYIVLSVPEDGVVELIEGRVEEWAAN